MVMRPRKESPDRRKQGSAKPAVEAWLIGLVFVGAWLSAIVAVVTWG
jgi:hypothetical protein